MKMNFWILLATVPSLVISAGQERNELYDDYDQFWKRVFESNKWVCQKEIRDPRTVRKNESPSPTTVYLVVRVRKYQLSLIFSNFFNDIENRNFQFSKRNIVRENPLAKLVENISGQSQSASSTWIELKILV